VPQLSIPKFLPERTGLPGVLTHRLTGGTNHSQRQQDQLTPEITRWQKANAKTLETETKASWHHQNPVLPPQRALVTNTPEKQDSDLKSYLMMMIEDFKKDINNSLEEIQENTSKQLSLKEETQKSLKELQENTTKQVKELNKTIQDPKVEIETIKKSQRETTLEIENLGKRSQVTDVNIINIIQEIEERLSGAEHTIENIDTTVKENAKCRKLLTQNIQEIQDTMRRPTLRIIGIEDGEESQLKWPENIFNKIIEESFPNLKRWA
jgi:chromosome segregation ATPase